MTFGLMLVPMAAMIGLAVDFGRVYAVNSSTQGALDAAALAVGRVAQVETDNMIAKASAAATVYFDQSKPKNVISSTLQFSPNSAQTAFTVTATSWVRTPFLSALDFIIKKDAQSGAPSACQGNFFKCVRLTTTSTAELKAGGDGGRGVVDARRDGLDVQSLHQDRSRPGCRQGPGRNRHLERSEPVHVQDRTGTVRGGGQRRQDAGPVGARNCDFGHANAHRL